MSIKFNLFIFIYTKSLDFLSHSFNLEAEALTKKPFKNLTDFKSLP